MHFAKSDLKKWTTQRGDSGFVVMARRSFSLVRVLRGCWVAARAAFSFWISWESCWMRVSRRWDRVGSVSVSRDSRRASSSRSSFGLLMPLVPLLLGSRVESRA